jgi:TonB family protein
MKNVLFIIVFFLFAITGNAQETIAKIDQNDLKRIQPEAKNLCAASSVSKEMMLKHTNQMQTLLTEFVSNDIQYPEALEAYGLEGQIIIDVWINTEGEIINTKIMKSFNNNFNAVVTATLQNFKLPWPQETSYLGARRLRVPIDFIME